MKRVDIREYMDSKVHRPINRSIKWTVNGSVDVSIWRSIWRSARVSIEERLKNEKS